MCNYTRLSGSTVKGETLHFEDRILTLGFDPFGGAENLKMVDLLPVFLIDALPKMCSLKLFKQLFPKSLKVVQLFPSSLKIFLSLTRNGPEMLARASLNANQE